MLIICDRSWEQVDIRVGRRGSRGAGISGTARASIRLTSRVRTSNIGHSCREPRRQRVDSGIELPLYDGVVATGRVTGRLQIRRRVDILRLPVVLTTKSTRAEILILWSRLHDRADLAATDLRFGVSVVGPAAEVIDDGDCAVRSRWAVGTVAGTDRIASVGNGDRREYRTGVRADAV